MKTTLIVFVLVAVGLCWGESPTSKPVAKDLLGLRAVVAEIPAKFLSEKMGSNWTDAQKELFAKWGRDSLRGRTLITDVIYDEAVREKGHWKVTFRLEGVTAKGIKFASTGSGTFQEDALKGWGTLKRGSTVTISGKIEFVGGEPMAESFWIGIDLGDCKIISAK